HFDGSPFHELTKGFWGQHLEAWDGGTMSNTNKWDKLATQTNPVLAHTDVLNPVDSNGDGIINSSDQKCVLLGDANGNGYTDTGESTLFIDLAVAQKLILSSDTATDTRQILASQAIAAQLNINNAFQTGVQAKEPVDLVGEAVKWLTGQS